MQGSGIQFSILIPTTGRVDITRLAIQSVLEQTFQNFELIIADSGSSEALQNFARSRKDARVKYFAVAGHPPFLPFDFASKKASGQYLMWLDDDNYLLPSALRLFDEAIVKSKAEIIAASHFYYYDNHHPRTALRNSLGIIPFTKKETFVSPQEALKSFYAFERKSTAKFPRFHFSATIFSRPLVERARNSLDFSLITNAPIIHQLQPLLFAFAQSTFWLDRPVAIIGRLGVSMSQNWSTAARKRFAKDPFKPVFSPASAYTRINIVLEEYLKVKHLLGERMANINVNYENFAKIYLQELLYLDTDLTTAIKNWINVLSFTKRLAPKVALVPIIYLARRLRLHHFWRWIRARWQTLQMKELSPAQKFRQAREFEIPLEKYDVHDIPGLAANVREIIKKEIGIEL